MTTAFPHLIMFSQMYWNENCSDSRFTILVSKKTFGSSIKVAILFIITHTSLIHIHIQKTGVSVLKCLRVFPNAQGEPIFLSYSHTKLSLNILCWVFFRYKRLINPQSSVLNPELWCAWIKADTTVIHTCTLLFPDRAVDCWRASASGELYRVDSSAMTWLWIQLKRSISLKDITKPLSWLNYWYRYWSANVT